jgi:subtilase family serine protease
MDLYGNRSQWGRARGALFACSVLVGPALHAQTQFEPPGIIAAATDLGRIQPTAPITLNVHLKMPDQQAFDQAVKALYTPGSPTYHHWMTNSQIAGYAPTAAEVQSVVNALKSNGLSVLSVGSDNLSIRVRGAASAVESAFQTQLHQFKYQGKTFHAHVTSAALAGAAGSLVRGVTGLTNIPMQSQLKYPVNPKTGGPLVVQQTATSSGLPFSTTTNCFGDPTAISLTTSGADLPFAAYVGNTYNSLPVSTPGSGITGGPVCAWTPTQLQAHYGLSAAYAQGLDGTGQTVVVVMGPLDAVQLQSDLTLFSNLTGLPAITSSNFTEIYPEGQSTGTTTSNVWQGEASLDVEWVHSFAPGAHIVAAIMPPDDGLEDGYEYAIDYARQNGLGTVISNSYGDPESILDAATVQAWEQTLQAAAAAGIAVNFGSGDSGDVGTGSPSAGGDSYPGSSAYATSVGGTSTGIPNGTPGGAEVGWGNNVTYLSASGNVLDPPVGSEFGFPGGSGGGSSIFFAKPSWQSALPGTARQSPDISALADPNTGAVFVTGGNASIVGGTSLATPIFSAIWAIANQAAGTSLGQAAPLLYTLPSTAINDVVPVGSDTNVSGILVDSNGETDYSANALLMAPLYSTTVYYSALYNNGGDGTTYEDISFGTDTSLTVTPGWDNVTGLGVPNGLAFINAVVSTQ